jgi:hypothetical protein
MQLLRDRRVEGNYLSFLFLLFTETTMALVFTQL